MDTNLPATRDERAVEEPDRRVERSRPVSVALVPFSLVVFVVLAFVMAAWTFLATAL
jgi:biopolymer transport protein ExbD